MSVVAESVEEGRAVEILAGLGVDAVQGYGISAPMPWPLAE